MILTELQNFVLNYHRVSLAEMELHFHLDGEALRKMLAKLVHKGRVRQLPVPHQCHGCTSCNPDTIEFYEWVDQTQSVPPHLPKQFPTKAQIHSTHSLGKDVATTDKKVIQHAVILHNCQARHQQDG